MAAEQESIRLAAEQESIRLATEQETARLAAEQEAIRLATEQETARLAAEQKLQKSMEELDIELEEVPEMVVNEVKEETQKVVEVKDRVTTTVRKSNHLEIIEALDSMKLSSQIRDAVEKSTTEHHFSVKIEKIESTIIAPQSFKNGKTIIGKLLDDNSVEIELLFQPEANDSVERFQMNHIVEIDAHIANWNLGRKRAIFSVHSYEYK